MRFPKQPPDAHGQHLEKLLRENSKFLFEAKPTLPDGRYLHWDDLRFRTPPEGMQAPDWWVAMRTARARLSVQVPAMSEMYDTTFSFVPLPSIQQALHELDRTNVGERLLSALGNEDANAEYRVRQLVEEAISSSEIEGARPTTRELARQMVREDRTPTSRDERMIYNNWRAMRRILELRDEDRALTVDDLLELHRILGEDSLDVPDASGRFRQPGQDVVVSDMQGNTWHTPPNAEGLRERVEALLRFANGLDGQETTFVHPIIRAIVVHFWVGYEHPFRDGNGRIARALYYWCMLRHGYEMAEFLSISGPIDRSPKAYYMAFAHTETDGGDLTYFVIHQLQVMRQALDALVGHLEQRAHSMQALAKAVAGFDELNYRQRALLQHRYPAPARELHDRGTLILAPGSLPDCSHGPREPGRARLLGREESRQGQEVPSYGCACEKAPGAPVGVLSLADLYPPPVRREYVGRQPEPRAAAYRQGSAIQARSSSAGGPPDLPRLAIATDRIWSSVTAAL